MSQKTTAKPDPDKTVNPVTFAHDPWEISCLKTHILQSKCYSPDKCQQSPASGDGDNNCTFCRYSNILELPSLPDMVFGDNYVRIKHKAGFGIEFTALDALRLVDVKDDLMKVAVSKAWKEAREDSEHIRDVIKPFDWTFTNNYKGTPIGTPMKAVPTSEKLNLDKLKQKEKILFYDNVHLFEDELADNGSASCSVKIRVMPSGYFILLRYYLRVDDVLIRMNDNRIHHEFGKPYMLQDYCSRESPISELKVPASILTDPNEIWHHLAVKEESVYKLEFPL